MVDIKNTLWSNQGMRSYSNHMPDAQRHTQHRSGKTLVAQWKSAQPYSQSVWLARGPIIVGSLLALLLILGKGAGSG